MTGESTFCTLLSSIKISVAFSHNSFTSFSVIISPRLNCSTCLRSPLISKNLNRQQLYLYLSRSFICNFKENKSLPLFTLSKKGKKKCAHSELIYSFGYQNKKITKVFYGCNTRKEKDLVNYDTILNKHACNRSR